MLYIDKGGDPEVVRESQRRRFADVALVDQVIELDQEWKAGDLQLAFECIAIMQYMIPNCACYVAISHMETLKMQRNALNKQIGEKRKVSTSCSLTKSVLNLQQPCNLCDA